MRIRATDDAVEAIREAGGRLYLWQEPFGADWVRDRMSTERPHEPGGFVVHDAEGVFKVLIEDGIEPPEDLAIVRRRIPPHRLQVLWDDETWGSRGSVAGGG